MGTKKKAQTGVTINRAKNKEFFITQASTNGNNLNTSETLKARSSAFKNIIASAKLGVAVLAGKAPVIDDKGRAYYFINGKFRKQA